MRIEKARGLREAWKAQGSPPCDHPIVDKERMDRGEHSGDFVCTTCGAYVDDIKGKSAPDGGKYI
jgi:hypothetical protein